MKKRFTDHVYTFYPWWASRKGGFRLRFFSHFCVFVILLSVIPGRIASAAFDTPVAASDPSRSAGLEAAPPAITAEYAVVVDDSGQVLYAKDLHHLAAPASLTKIVTALVALDKGNLSDIVKARIDSRKFEEETNGTVMGLMPGEEMSLGDLLYGMLLPSANDAAITIAEYIGGGSQEQFVQMMNDKVRSLGLLNSRFSNPHGLDANGHLSTAYEMAMLGRYAMQNPIFAKIVGTKRITVQGKQRSYNLVNVNTMLSNYAGTDGVKIGYTYKAKNSIVATAVRNGRRLYVSLIRSDDRDGDCQRLLDFFFANPPTPTPTAVPSPTSTPVPTATPSPTITPTPPNTPTPIATPSSQSDGGSDQNTSTPGWLEALTSLPKQAVQMAFSVIAKGIP